MYSRLEALIAAICVLLSGAQYVMLNDKNASVAMGEFSRLTQGRGELVQSRLEAYLQTVQGISAFIKASSEVLPDEFEAYLTSLDFEDILPGIGWIVPVRGSEIDAFLLERRADGQLEYEFRKLISKDTHYIIKYIYPKGTNTSALGLDFTLNPSRRVLLDRARDMVMPQMTPPVQLVQGAQTRPGLIVFHPVFAHNADSEQAGPFLGWVSLTFTTDDLLSSLPARGGGSYYTEIFDGESADESKRIFTDQNPTTVLGSYSTSYQIEHFGRIWTFVYTSNPAFDVALHNRQPLMLLIIGLIASGLLVYALRVQRLRSDGLLRIAQARTRQIETRDEEMRSIVENSVASVIVLDGDDRILQTNHAAQLSFGYSQAEMTVLRFDQICRTFDHSEGGLNALGTTKSGERLELDLQRNTWLEIEGERRTTAIIRDLTEQSQAQRELERSKILFDMALQGAQIGVFDINLAEGKSEVSSTWCRVMGFDEDCRDRDTQRNFLSRVHPDDVHILQKADEDCIGGKTERSIAEYRIKFEDGSWRWMRSDAVVVECDHEGTALRMIGTQTDVTELRHDRNALELSEQKFRQVLLNAPIGMVLMDYSGNLLGVNSAFCALAGRTEDDLLNNRRLVDLMPYEDRKVLYSAITKLFEDESKSVYTAQHRILHNEGEDRWGLVNVSWSFDKNANNVLFIAQIIDITDQKKHDRIKNEFVATVSHELRTPLTSIKGALGLLLATATVNLNKNEFRLVEIASTNADRLTDIVNDILDLEKLSSGEVPFEIDEVDLSEVMADTVSDISPLAFNHGNSLRIETPESAVMVRADTGRTKQVLTNLISNACKYSNAQTEILLRIEQIDEKIIVFVQNTGPGIPDAFRPQIFKAFSQADSSDTRAKGGTGLGLNISRQIIHKLGGEIGYESVQDGVTVFWFTLPRCEHGARPKRVLAFANTAADFEKLRVLHIEGDHDFAEVISGALEAVAIVDHSSSIASARHQIETSEFEVIIVDWNLPDGDGQELLEVISTRHPTASIIALSADGGRASDPRVRKSFLKSRTDFSILIAEVCNHRASA